MFEYLTKEEFETLAQSDKYWLYRWEYLSKVIEISKELKFESVLELGAYNKNIIKNCDTMDVINYLKPTYLWNATKTPYPIKDKQYDLFIALQVWEHLYENEKTMTNPKQKEAFGEVMRISKMAILSFPYMWNCEGDCHHMIDKEKIKEWTLGIEPKKIELAESVANRLIYLFVF